MKHTPGPWLLDWHNPNERIVLSYHRIEGDERELPYHIVIVPYASESKLDKANARLIAAAPDLLKACQVAIDALGCDRTRQDRLEAQKIINAAIIKAKGERE